MEQTELRTRRQNKCIILKWQLGARTDILTKCSGLTEAEYPVTSEAAGHETLLWWSDDSLHLGPKTGPADHGL